MHRAMSGPPKSDYTPGSLPPAGYTRAPGPLVPKGFRGGLGIRAGLRFRIPEDRVFEFEAVGDG
jgi:hypothetical protein